MRIVFMGTPEFAVPSLRTLVNSGFEIAAVVTNPDEPRGRGLKVFPPAIKSAAEGLGLPVIQVASLKDPGFAGSINSISPDLIVVVAFRILPREIFTIPKLGTFNLHASLLPRYRGAAPINWAIINGERETGVTTFFLDDKVDTGRIILQKKITIGGDETAGELADRLSATGSDAVLETVKMIEQGTVKVMEQDGTLATKAPKISKEDCLIEWSKPAEAVHNFIRGFSPEPAAFSFMNGKMLKVFRTKRTGESNTDQPGSVSVVGGRLFVGCGDEKLEILELQSEGKKKLDAREFVRGARIESGTRLNRSSI